MPQKSTPPRQDEIITFLRKRDYKLVRELGEGACGKTVLLHDEQIQEELVCKKYAPQPGVNRQEHFIKFTQEIKLLHRLHHPNVVRVFNHYLYPEQLSGYILMEFIDGQDIETHAHNFPERLDELFLQAIAGFAYLERSGVLHRDIRPANIMVSNDGILKIIDLGFGKQIALPNDFDKSISLNWWCETPDEFNDGRYDFGTEVYFIGKLFERIIQANNITQFKYMPILKQMCKFTPSERAKNFSSIETTIKNSQFSELNFGSSEIQAYRNFTDSLCRHITKIDQGAKYFADIQRIQSQLQDLHRGFMLENFVPDAATVTRCFVDGVYYYRKVGLYVATVTNFISLLRRSTDDQKRIILANIHTRLNAVPRYTKESGGDVPF